MAMQKPGYDNWQYHELSKEEKTANMFLQVELLKAFKEAGYPDDVVKSIKLEFGKATLSIKDEEARTGAFHKLEGKEPFYRMQITAEGKSMNDAVSGDKSAHLLFGLSQVYGQLGGAGMTMGNPLVFHHDFKGDILEKGEQLLEVVKLLAPQILKP